MTCSQAFACVGALGPSGLPLAFTGSRLCGDWRKLDPSGAGLRPSDNNSRMAWTEGLFTGLTLFISAHQRMSRTKTGIVDSPPHSMQQLEINVTFDSTLIHRLRLPSGSNRRQTDLSDVPTAYLEPAGLHTDGTRRLPLPDRVTTYAHANERFLAQTH